jgi:hypothetical protein
MSRGCDTWLLRAVLSTTAGAVDVIGLALGGLFTAHITGNLARRSLLKHRLKVSPLGSSCELVMGDMVKV